MKRFVPHPSPAARIALGLISLVVTLLLLVDIALKLVPDQSEMQRKIRESTSERLAVQVTSLIQAQEWDTLKSTLNESLNRDHDMLSIAVRTTDGQIAIRAGDHQHHWNPPPPGKSTLTAIRVPIYAHDAHWGDVEISYKAVTPQSLMDWLRMPLLALMLVVTPAGFLAFYLYMRRALQYLDPSAAIPDRVRVAFDALTEGVVVADKAGRIMLYNKAFRQLHPYATDDMIGKPLGSLSWLAQSGEAVKSPWEQAMQTEANVSGRQFSILQPDQTMLRLIVSAAPIKDARARLRGCMVTFYDVTELHRANEQMRATLVALEASRSKIEQQNEELTRLATRDPLTGCLNRRAFFSMAEPLFGKLRHEARNLTCIMVDIDRFKLINDTYGHLIGDQAIIALTRILSNRLRSNDLLCRFGGEEFCIVLPNTSADEAAEIAERLRLEIEQHGGQSIRTVRELRFTASFGVAGVASGADSLSELIELSDFALYTSKRNGRNRVTIWSPGLADKEAAQQIH